MASYRKAVISEIVKKSDDLVKTKIKLADTEVAAISYPRLTGPVEVGDEVIVNTTAGELSLGSGGFHIIVWNLRHGDIDIPSKGHIMKLRYTPLQSNVLAAEEDASGNSAALREFSDLNGMPVVVGTLHSQLAPAAAVLRRTAGPKTRIAYMMTDGAALPLALSDQVRELKEKGLIDMSITVGQAFGGDYEAVNVFSGLATAKTVAKADVVIVAMGVGVVGTESFLGFSGIEQGQLVNAIYSMRGRPIAIARLNFHDKRPRHKGLDEQTVAALGVAALVPCELPLPHMDADKLSQIIDRLERSGLAGKHRVKIVSQDDTRDALREFDLKPTTMGRGFDEEPEFFRTAGAAGYLAAKMLGSEHR